MASPTPLQLRGYVLLLVLCPFIALALYFKDLRGCWNSLYRSSYNSEGRIGCSTWLSEDCLRAAAVARYVRDHVDHTTRLMTIVENTGVPVIATLDEDVMYTMWYPEWSDDELVSRMHPLDKKWRRDLLYVNDALSTLQIQAWMTFGSIQQLFGQSIIVLEDSSALREISSNVSHPMLRRLQAGMAANRILSAVAGPLHLDVRSKLTLLNEVVEPLIAKAFIASASYGDVLKAADPVIALAENQLREIPRFWRWAFYFFNARNSRITQLVLSDLKHGYETIRRKGEMVDIVHENAVRLRDYLRWYNNTMIHEQIIDNYKPSGLRTADEEVKALRLELESYRARNIALKTAVRAKELVYPPRRTFADLQELPPSA